MGNSSPIAKRCWNVGRNAAEISTGVNLPKKEWRCREAGGPIPREEVEVAVCVLMLRKSLNTDGIPSQRRSCSYS